MGFVIVAIQDIGECLNISQRLPISHVLQNCFSESAIEMFHYLSFNILKSGKMVHAVFLQQLFDMSIVKLFSLVHVQLLWIADMIESPPQGCSHFLIHFPLDGNRKSQSRKTVYDGQDKSAFKNSINISIQSEPVYRKGALPNSGLSLHTVKVPTDMATCLRLSEFYLFSPSLLCISSFPNLHK